MNLPSQRGFLRTLALLTACLALANRAQAVTYYTSGSETSLTVSGYMNFKVPPERVGHSFKFKWRPTSGATDYSSRDLSTMGLSSSNGIGMNPQITHVAVYAPPPTFPLSSFIPYDWYVLDSTANQATEMHYGTVASSVSLLTSTWSAAPGGDNTRFLAIPTTRSGHALMAGTAGNMITVAIGQTIGTYSNGSYGTPVTLWIAGSANPSGTTFFVADRTTDEKANLGKSDVRDSALWTYDSSYNIYAPFLSVNTTLNSYELGHWFTVHYKLGSAPECPVRVQATTLAGGGVGVNFLAPSGIPLWLTRDAENFTSPRPVAPSATTTWTATTNGQTFSAVSPTDVFPQTPSRVAASVKSHTFRVNAHSREGHVFTVRMDDGYSTAFTGAPALVGAHLDNWQNNGTYDPLPLYVITAQIDVNFNTVLYDETTGAAVITADRTITSEDVLDGWSAAHGSAPQYTEIALQLPQSRIGRTLTLLNGATGAGDFLVPNPSTENPLHTQSHDGFDLEDGTHLDGYDSEYIEFSLDSPLPYLNAFTLADTLAPTGDTTPTLAASSAASPYTNDLRSWWLPPENRIIPISSSRWGHTLQIRQPNADAAHPHGELFATAPHYVDGNTTFVGNRLFYESYYYFNIDAQVRGELPWYIEDTTTSERIGPFAPDAPPGNETLMAWISTPAPASLTATEDSAGGIALEWPLSNASRDGFYSIEINTGAGWLADTTILSGVANASTNLINRIRYSETYPQEIRYRVRFNYGGQSSAYSPEVVFHWTDNDVDGLPDAWERAWGLDPTDAADANIMLIGDGRTATDLYTDAITLASLTNNGANPSPQFAYEVPVQLDYVADWVRYSHIKDNGVWRSTTTTDNSWDDVDQIDDESSQKIGVSSLGSWLDGRNPLPSQFPALSRMLDYYRYYLGEGVAWTGAVDPDDGKSPEQASLSHLRHLLRAPSPVPLTITREYLKATWRQVDDNPVTIETEPVTLTIPAGQTQSNPGDLTPNFTISSAGGEHSEWLEQELLSAEILPDPSSQGVIGDVIRSAKKGSSVKHFVTPKKSDNLNQDYVELTANVGAERFAQFFIWDTDHPDKGVVGSAANKYKVKRDQTGEIKVWVKTKDGVKIMDQMDVWVVWATTVVKSPGIMHSYADDQLEGYSNKIINDFGVQFKFEIKPKEIVTGDEDGEKPFLAGPPPKRPPGNAKNWCMNPDLPADTAFGKWDVSRQLNIMIQNPGSIPRSELALFYPFLSDPNVPIDHPVSFPEDPVEGNDDCPLLDESDNPYDPYHVETGLEHEIGELSSFDAPKDSVKNSWGTDGLVFSVTNQFREFVRLQLWDEKRVGGTFWFKISDDKVWFFRSSFIFKDPPSEWQNGDSDWDVPP